MSAPAAGAIAIVEDAFAVVKSGGADRTIELFDRLCTEDFEWRPALGSMVEGRTYRGRTGWTAYWEEFRSVFGEPEFDTVRFESVAPDVVLVSGSIRVTGEGSRVPIDQEATWVFVIRDGKLAAGRSFLAREEALKFAHGAAMAPQEQR